MENDNRPRIVMRASEIPQVTDQAEAALIAAGSPIYHRGGALVRPCRVGQLKLSQAVVKRGDDSIVIVPVIKSWLIEEMTKSAQWMKSVSDAKSSTGWRLDPADPKPIYAETLLGRNGVWRFNPLRRVVTTPTITMEGRVIQAPGYDKESGMLLNFEPNEYSPIGEAPTKDEARKALDRIAWPFREMPWDNPESKSVALSAMITSILRPNMRTAPLHGFNSPGASNGKSLLAETVAALSMGTVIPSMTYSKAQEENEKRLSTVLAYGDPVILLDNCSGDIAGDFLCSVLTQETVQARILGLSERRILPSSSFILATGVNLSFAGDVSRRAVMCTLDAKMEHPENRKFDFNPRDDTLAGRGTMVSDVITVMRAYHVADRPVSLKAMGSFEDWSFVREALVWLGEVDPIDSRKSVVRTDPERDDLVEIIRLWDVAFQERRVHVSYIEKDVDSEAIAALRAKFIDVACSGSSRWSGKAVGRWLMRKYHRVIGDRYFDVLEDPKKGHQWTLRKSQGTLFEDEPGVS